MAPDRSLFSYNNLVHALSGGCGSAVAMSTFYPLDTVRTRLQLQKKSLSDPQSSQQPKDGVTDMLQHILMTEGWAGLYKVLKPVIQSLYCSNFVYFYSFHGLKKAFNPDKTAINDLLCGMAAGVINVMSTTPLWVVNTRLKMKGVGQRQYNYNGMLDGLQKVHKQEGLTGLWAGCTSSLILVINPAIQFMAYESMKRHLLSQSGGLPPSSVKVFLAGAIAKAIATVLTYPIQLAQARQRHGSSKQGMLKLLQAVLKDDGPAGLFRGLKAKLLQTVLTAALMFLCYEKISAVVFTLMMGSKATVVAKHK